MTRCRDDLDLDATLYLVRDNLGKADAFITAAEDLIKESREGDGSRDDDDDAGPDDGDDELRRHRNHVAHMVGSAKFAVRKAIYARSQLRAKLDKHQVVSDPAEVVATTSNNFDPGAPITEGAQTPTFDIAGAVDILREIIKRTEALVCASEDLLEQDPWGDEGDELRTERLAHLLGAAREAARAAVDAGSQIAHGLAMHRANA